MKALLRVVVPSRNVLQRREGAVAVPVAVQREPSEWCRVKTWGQSILTGEGKVLILPNHQAVTQVFVTFSGMHSLFQKAFSVLPM